MAARPRPAEAGLNPWLCTPQFLVLMDADSLDTQCIQPVVGGAGTALALPAAAGAALAPFWPGVRVSKGTSSPSATAASVSSPSSFRRASHTSGSSHTARDDPNLPVSARAGFTVSTRPYSSEPAQCAIDAVCRCGAGPAQAVAASPHSACCPWRLRHPPPPRIARSRSRGASLRSRLRVNTAPMHPLWRARKGVLSRVVWSMGMVTSASSPKGMKAACSTASVTSSARPPVHGTRPQHVTRVLAIVHTRGHCAGTHRRRGCVC